MVSSRYVFRCAGIRVVLCVLVAMTCLAMPSALWGQAVTLLEPGQAAAPIATLNMDARSGPRQQLVNMVRDSLKKMTGADFPALPPAASLDDLPRPAIVFALRPLVDAQGKPLPDDAYTLQTLDGRLVITSESRVGLSYGFHDLMERLGARYWSYNEEDIPSRSSVVIEQLDVLWNPPFRIHDIMSREAQTGENHFRDKSRNYSNLRFTGNHTLYALLTPHAKKNPEIYPLVKTLDPKTKAVIKQERKPNDLHFCYSHPDIAQALADALSAEVEKRKGNVKDFIYFAGMGDWYGGACACDRCMAIYQEEKWEWKPGQTTNGYSGSLLRMINKTAELLNAKYPGITVGTFAYMSFEMPSSRTKPADNVMIYMPRLRHCTVHGAEECEKNQRFMAGLEEWVRQAPGRVYVWEYGTSYVNFFHPFPALYSMAANIKTYHRIGVTGIDIQGNYVSTGGHQVVLNNYVWSRLMRDPSLDTQQLIHEFTEGYYGPAAGAVREYVAILEKAPREPQMIHADEFADMRKAILRPEVVAGLQAQIDEARRLTAGADQADYRRRVEELSIGVQALRLWTRGELKEQDGRLVRVDLGGDTFEEAKQMRAISRNASPREWGSGKRYWMEMIGLHGGPAARVEQGSLSMLIAPAIRAGGPAVSFDQKEIIRRTYISSLTSGEFVGEPAPGRVVTTGESGVGHWSHEAKHIIEQVFTPGQAGGLMFESSIRRVHGAAGHAHPQLGVLTDLPAPMNSSSLKLSWRDAAGNWHDVPKLPAFRQVLEFPDITAWRVRDQGVEYVDTYEPLLPAMVDGQPQRPRGTLTLNGTPRTYTLGVQIQLRDLPMKQDVQWLRRTLTATPMP